MSAVGMITSVGLSAPETWAAVRSATMRLTESAILDRRAEPITLGEVHPRGIPPLAAAAAAAPALTSRERRLIRLAGAALRECLKPLGDKARPLPLLFALPDTTTRPLDGKQLLQRLAAQVPGAIDLDLSTAIPGGRAAGIMAVAVARDLIAAGKATRVLVGGGDTYRDLNVLATLEIELRLKTSAALDGFIPAEGAGFLLITRPDVAAIQGIPAIACISGIADGFETGHLYSTEPYRGEGLAQTVRKLTSETPPPSPFRSVVSSMNGESHWGKEWGVTFIRNRGAFDPEFDIMHPADAFGDIGAAAGPVLVGLATLALRDRRAAAPVLVYCSSDRGARAAAMLTLPA